MCSRTSPFTQMMVCHSNNILANLGHFTILILLDDLSSYLSYPYFQIQFWRTFNLWREVTCLIFMLAHEWNCIVFRPVVLFPLRTSIASCHSTEWPCIFFRGLFSRGLSVLYPTFLGIRGIYCVLTRLIAVVFMTWNRRLWFPWVWSWFQERFNWVFEWNRRRRTLYEEYNFSKIKINELKSLIMIKLNKVNEKLVK